MNSLKIIVIITWVLGSLGFVIQPDTTVAKAGQLLVAAMAIIHIVEFLVYIPVLRQAGGSMGGHFVRVFFLGFLHYRDVKLELESRSAQAAQDAA